MHFFDFKISKIDSVFDDNVLGKLRHAFHLPDQLETSGAVDVDQELRFRGIKGRRADIEASIIKEGKDSFLMLTVSYGEKFTQNACGSRRFLESPMIWESERIGPIKDASSIAGIYAGDINHDRKTDLLVLFSSGAAYVFQQVPGRTPPTTCESKYD